MKLFRWLEKRRFRKLRRAAQLARLAAQPEPEPVPDHVSVNAILSDIEKSRLEFAKLEWEHKIAELNATAAERQDEREYKRKLAEEDRERKRKAAADMRERRARMPERFSGRKAGGIPPAAQNCADCQAILQFGDITKRATTKDMIRHAQQNHDLFFAGNHGSPN